MEFGIDKKELTPTPVVTRVKLGIEPVDHLFA